MGVIIPLIIIIGIVIYIVEIIMEPEKHKVALVVLAIFAALFGAFGDSSNKRKRR